MEKGKRLKSLQRKHIVTWVIFRNSGKFWEVDELIFTAMRILFVSMVPWERLTSTPLRYAQCKLLVSPIQGIQEFCSLLGCYLILVPWERLELSQDCSYTPLKRARLPVPPPRHCNLKISPWILHQNVARAELNGAKLAKSNHKQKIWCKIDQSLNFSSFHKGIPKPSASFWSISKLGFCGVFPSRFWIYFRLILEHPASFSWVSLCFFLKKRMRVPSWCDVSFFIP